jgi:hypothetical protein
MATTVNLLSDRNGFYSSYLEAERLTISEASSDWQVIGAAGSYISTEFITTSRFVFRAAPSGTSDIIFVLNAQELNQSENGKFLSFNSKIKPGDACSVRCVLSVDGQQADIGFTQNLSGGVYGAVQSNIVQIPDNGLTQYVSASIFVSGHEGQNVFMTYPNLIDDRAFYENDYLAYMKNFMPDFYWELDSRQSQPTAPYHRFMDILTSSSYEVYREYAAIYRFDREELALSDYTSEIWAKSVLVDPSYVRQKYINWLFQFTGNQAVKNIKPNDATSLYGIKSTRTNLVTNPSFETNTTGWVAATGATNTRTSSQSVFGSWSISQTRSSTTGSLSVQTSPRISVTAGLDYTFSLYFRRSYSTTRTTSLRFQWYNSGGTIIGTTITQAITPPAVNTWGRFSMTRTAPAGATTVYCDILVSNAVVGEVIFVDGIMLEQSSTLLPYFDGTNSSPYADYTLLSRVWTGTANASTSTTTWGLNSSFYDSDQAYFLNQNTERQFVEWQLNGLPYGVAAGTRESLVSAARQVLSRTKNGQATTGAISLTPGFGGNPWVFLVRTLSNETIDAEVGDPSKLVLAAMEPARPMGYQIIHETVDVLNFILNDLTFGRLNQIGLGGVVAPTLAPQNVVATEIGSNYVVLSFIPMSVSGYGDGGGVISNYRYYLSTNGGSTYTSGTLLSPAKGSPPIRITGLSTATQYYVKLKAINEAGEGVQESVPVVFTTL